VLKKEDIRTFLIHIYPLFSINVSYLEEKKRKYVKMALCRTIFLLHGKNSFAEIFKNLARYTERKVFSICDYNHMVK